MAMKDAPSSLERCAEPVDLVINTRLSLSVVSLLLGLRGLWVGVRVPLCLSSFASSLALAGIALAKLAETWHGMAVLAQGRHAISNAHVASSCLDPALAGD